MVDLEKIKKIKDYLGRKPLPKKNTIEGEICKNAYDIFKNFSEQILAEVNKKLEQESKIDLCLQCVNWSKGTKVTEQLWSQLKLADYKDYPFSISLFYTKEDQFLITLEFKDDDLNNLIKKENKEPNPENYTKIKKIKDLYKNFRDLKNAQIDGFNLIASDKRLYEYFLPQDNEIVNKSINSILTLYPYYQKILGEENSDNTPQNGNNNRTGEPAMTNIPLNQILYGPPGTGKTYNTVVKAMEIINPDCIKYDKKGNVSNYSDVKIEFDNAKKEHQIEFVTFHQSYSYEEFVEGIKPYIPKDIWEIDKDKIDEKFKEQNENQEVILPDIKYIGQKGLFKKICKNAEEDPKKENTINTLTEISFDELWEQFKNKYKDGDEIEGLRSKQVIHYINNGDSLQYQTNTENPPSLPKYKVGEYYKEHKISPIENTKDLLEVADKLGKGKGENGVQPLLWAVVHAIEEIEQEQEQKQTKEATKKFEKKPYVLIIDEINRGNISKIFGELITLIEEDKRAGMPNAMKTTLPYSQEPFDIPKNLYIIGTMNTADRSIANVDIALRRRFKFVEMMPQKDIVADYGCNFKAVFDKLNKRIAALLDRDHQIGHSYFINGGNVNTLKDIWFDSVMPLLNEYFYSDWEKLQAILGKAEDEKGTSFIVSHKTNNLFATPDNENPCDGDYYDFREKSEYDNIENFKKAMNHAFIDFLDNKAEINDNKQDNQAGQTDNT